MAVAQQAGTSQETGGPGRSAVGPKTRALSGLAAYLVGVVVLPVGAGLAVPHAVKTGLSATTVAGVLVLLAGMALLVAGAVGLVRSVSRWWRLAVVPVLVVVAAVGGWSIGYAVAATHVPPTPLGSVTPADHGLAFREVEFTTDDGVTLSGWYVPGSGSAAVVLMHGAGSNRAAPLDQAAVLARHGFGVLLVDARGHGDSDGRAMDLGWYGDADVTAAVTFLLTQPGVGDGQVGVVGLSMGGEEAIGAAAADPRIRAVVAEGATGRVGGDRAWMSDEYGWRGSVQEGLDWLMFATTDVLTEADEPGTLRGAVAAADDTPVLLVAAGAVADEVHAGRFIRSGSPDTVRLWVVQDAGHTQGLDTAPEQWERRVTGFLDRALGSAR